MSRNKFLEKKIHCLSFESWVSQNGHDVEREYEMLHDEYGDAMGCFLSDYKKQKYSEYLEKFRAPPYFFY